MKYRTTPAFDGDYRRLPADHRAAFKAAVVQFNAGAEAAAAGHDAPWPNGLRVKAVRGTARVWEMTWSMTEPDGRATWEWVDIDGERGILWRRIGDHAIFKRA